MSSDDRATALAERTATLREGVRGSLHDGVGQATDRARERAGEVRALTREGSVHARERAGEIAESLAPARRRAQYQTGSMLRWIARLLALVPGLLARSVTSLTHMAESTARQGDELTERGRELAARLGPPKRVRRRTRTRTLAWFAGGVAIGAAAGWLAHEQYAAQHPDARQPDARAGEGGAGDQPATFPSADLTSEANRN